MFLCYSISINLNKIICTALIREQFKHFSVLGRDRD